MAMDAEFSYRDGRKRHASSPRRPARNTERTMNYDTVKNDHGLRHNPMKALVTPRPIGWISTLDRNGVANLAPYSFFNLVSDIPPCVAFSQPGTCASR
jgi:flavin reductase (DIM6/NTAB) family NADH-FMN oxidoreductase RutF